MKYEFAHFENSPKANEGQYTTKAWDKKFLKKEQDEIFRKEQEKLQEWEISDKSEDAEVFA